MLLKLYNDHNSEADLQRVVNLLNDGGILIFPTDCRYAVGCNALKTNAVNAVCRLKGINPQKNRLSIICYDLSTISEFSHMDNNVFKIMRRNLPGPFTFILSGTSRLPKIFAGRKEIGIRMPQNAVIMEIARRLQSPILVASLPSENQDDEAYNLNPELIDELYGGRVDLVIDGGLAQNTETTVVDCTSSTPQIVRQGIGELIE